MGPEDEPPVSSGETMEQLLQAAALETDSDKLLELFRKIAKLNQLNNTSSGGNPRR